MNIYFTASVSQRDSYGKEYQVITNLLKKLGHKVVHEHVTSSSLKEVYNSSHEENEKYYHQVQKWISEADIVVAEISYPSTLNIGHEVTLALDKSKPVIGLYRTGKGSAFFEGIKSEKFVYEEYTPQTLEKVLEDAVNFASESADTRFNFLIPSRLLDYLDWVAKNQNTPRSVYLRNLIEGDLAKNKKYQVS